MLASIRRLVSGIFFVLAIIVLVSERPDGMPMIITLTGISMFVILLILAIMVWPAKVSHIARALIDEITTPS